MGWNDTAPLTEAVYLDTHRGEVSIDTQNESLTWTLTNRETLVIETHVADWGPTGNLDPEFRPTAFCMIQPHLAVVAGVNTGVNEGALVLVTLNIDPDSAVSMEQRPLYMGLEFTNICSMDNLVGGSAIALLDDVEHKVVLFDLRTRGFTHLADESNDARMTTAKYVQLGQHHDEIVDVWLGLSVMVSEVPPIYAFREDYADRFVYLIADTTGDGAIDLYLTMRP